MSSDVLRGLNTIEGSAAKAGKLEPEIHELIASAVAVTTGCDGCTIHAKTAVELGATREEIAEALGVAIALNAVVSHSVSAV